jgi:hypothetical protein
MRTNIDLQDDLVNEALALSGTRTKREVVELALRELIARRKRPSIHEIFGVGGLDPDFDYKTARGGGPWLRAEQPLATYGARASGKAPSARKASRKSAAVKKVRA